MDPYIEDFLIKFHCPRSCRVNAGMQTIRKKKFDLTSENSFAQVFWAAGMVEGKQLGRHFTITPFAPVLNYV